MNFLSPIMKYLIAYRTFFAHSAKVYVAMRPLMNYTYVYAAVWFDLNHLHSWREFQGSLLVHNYIALRPYLINEAFWTWVEQVTKYVSLNVECPPIWGGCRWQQFGSECWLVRQQQRLFHAVIATSLLCQANVHSIAPPSCYCPL